MEQSRLVNGQHLIHQEIALYVVSKRLVEKLVIIAILERKTKMKIDTIRVAFFNVQLVFCRKRTNDVCKSVKQATSCECSLFYLILFCRNISGNITNVSILHCNTFILYKIEINRIVRCKNFSQKSVKMA